MNNASTIDQVPPELDKYTDIIKEVAANRPDSTEKFNYVMEWYEPEIAGALENYVDSTAPEVPEKYDTAGTRSTIELIGSLTEHTGHDLRTNVNNLMSFLKTYNENDANDIVPLVTDTFRDILDGPDEYEFSNFHGLHESFTSDDVIGFIQKHHSDDENNCIRTLAGFIYNIPNQRFNLNRIIRAADTFSDHDQENDSLVNEVLNTLINYAKVDSENKNETGLVVHMSKVLHTGNTDALQYVQDLYDANRETFKELDFILRSA